MVQIDARNGRCHDRPSSSLRRLARTIATPGLSAGSEHETIGRLRGLGARTTAAQTTRVSIGPLIPGDSVKPRMGARAEVRGLSEVSYACGLATLYDRVTGSSSIASLFFGQFTFVLIGQHWRISSAGG